MLVIAAEPLFVYLFVTWHLTSWQWSRVPNRRAGVDVIDLWGGDWRRPNQECLNRFSSSEGRTLALSALLWTTKCHSRRTEIVDISMLCISMLYAHILLFFPLFSFSKCCSCCKTMHRVHFQRLSSEWVHVSLARTGLISFKKHVCEVWVWCHFFWTGDYILKKLFYHFSNILLSLCGGLFTLDW